MDGNESVFIRQSLNSYIGTLVKAEIAHGRKRMPIILSAFSCITSANFVFTPIMYGMNGSIMLSSFSSKLNKTFTLPSGKTRKVCLSDTISSVVQ